MTGPRFPISVRFEVSADADDDEGHLAVVEDIIRTALADHGYLEPDKAGPYLAVDNEVPD